MAKEQSSAHWDINWNEPTIDEQITLIDHMLRACNLVGSPTYKINDPMMLLTIKNSLQSIKRWNESPAYHGKVDVEKVIEDLLHQLKIGSYSGKPREEAIQNAEAALGMLQAFREKREITAKDVADAHHAGKNILDRKTFIPQAKRDELVKEVVGRIAPRYATYNVDDLHKAANAIIYAIEEMDRLRKQEL